MAVTPVLACYRTSDAAVGGITAWQLTTGPSGPRTDVVGSCPLGDASWVTPLYDLVVVLCERDGTLCVVRPARGFQVVATVLLTANVLATAPLTPLGVLWPWPITPQVRSNSSTSQTPLSQQSKVSSASARAASFLNR